jgi:hypothetical protein
VQKRFLRFLHFVGLFFLYKGGGRCIPPIRLTSAPPNNLQHYCGLDPPLYNIGHPKCFKKIVQVVPRLGPLEFTKIFKKQRFYIGFTKKITFRPLKHLQNNHQNVLFTTFHQKNVHFLNI